VRLEDRGAARRLSTGVHTLVGGLVLRRHQLTFDTQHRCQKQKGSSHAPIVPEVWEDPIRIMR